MHKSDINKIDRSVELPKVVSTSCLDVLEEYLASHQAVQSNVEGRIVILNRPYQLD